MNAALRVLRSSRQNSATGCGDNSRYWVTWSIVRVETDAPGPLPSPPFATLTASHTGKCLDVSAISKDNGAEMVQWDCSGGGNQKWKIEEAGGGLVTLRASHSGKCLDVSGISRDNAASIVQWECWGGDNQKWRVENAGGGLFTLKAAHSGKCLDVAGGGRENGTRVIQWDCWGGDNQKWRIDGMNATQAVRPSGQSR